MNKKLSNATLLEGFKPKSSETYDFQNPQENNNSSEFCPFMEILLLVQKSRNFKSRPFHRYKVVKKNTLMEEIKSLFMEKYYLNMGIN